MKEKPIVLVIEDNPRQSALCVKVIEESGKYQVLAAMNGIEAFAILKRHRRGFDFLTNNIACILLDWQMPEMNGEQFIRKLRRQENKSPFKRHIPIVIVSAYRDKERLYLAEDPTLGLASGYLVKPIDEQELLNTLHRIVFNHEAEILRDLMVEKRIRKASESRH